MMKSPGDTLESKGFGEKDFKLISFTVLYFLVWMNLITSLDWKTEIKENESLGEYIMVPVPIERFSNEVRKLE